MGCPGGGGGGFLPRAWHGPEHPVSGTQQCTVPTPWGDTCMGIRCVVGEWCPEVRAHDWGGGSREMSRERQHLGRVAQAKRAVCATARVRRNWGFSGSERGWSGVGPRGREVDGGRQRQRETQRDGERGYSEWPPRHLRVKRKNSVRGAAPRLRGDSAAWKPRSGLLPCKKHERKQVTLISALYPI